MKPVPVAKPPDETPPIRVLRRGEPGYPARALDLDDPPEVLHVLGAWPPRDFAVAIVGARAATPYGLAQAARLAGDLARLGAVVVSGLAYGIDAAAHHGALEAGGPTLAVLPSAHDRITPKGHEPLAARIAAEGAVVSEYPAGTEAWKSSFLHRNRLIAAFAQAVVVVEARERSGALNTAGHARKLGRPLLAVPGDLDRPTSRGCHALIRAGAAICEGAGDVMTAIESGAAAVTPAARLLATFASGPRTLEACARECSLSIPEAQACLLDLEWAGLVRAQPGARWARVERPR